MQRKYKLAELILIEAEALKSTKNVKEAFALAEEITKDAVELAKLIKEEKEMSLKAS